MMTGKMMTCISCGELLKPNSIHDCMAIPISSDPTSFDPINHPAHYTAGRIEVIDFIEDQGFCYHLGNVVKYICRAGRKGDPIEDLKKARWYLDRYISKLETKP